VSNRKGKETQARSQCRCLTGLTLRASVQRCLADSSVCNNSTTECAQGSRGQAVQAWTISGPQPPRTLPAAHPVTRLINLQIRSLTWLHATRAVAVCLSSRHQRTLCFENSQEDASRPTDDVVCPTKPRERGSNRLAAGTRYF
jgi:hypothetical protein